jgi:hypothetical protein
MWLSGFQFKFKSLLLSTEFGPSIEADHTQLAIQDLKKEIRKMRKEMSLEIKSIPKSIESIKPPVENISPYKITAGGDCKNDEVKTTSGSISSQDSFEHITDEE